MHTPPHSLVMYACITLYFISCVNMVGAQGRPGILSEAAFYIWCVSASMAPWLGVYLERAVCAERAAREQAARGEREGAALAQRVRLATGV
jgi:hypothetical protein